MILNLLVNTFFKSFVILFILGLIGWFGLQFGDDTGAQYATDATVSTQMIVTAVPVNWLPYIAMGIVVVFLGSLLHSFKHHY